MTFENKPLSSEWLRQLRDANASNDLEKARIRREEALELAKRFDLKLPGKLPHQTQE